MSRRTLRPRLFDVALVFALAFGVHVRGGIDTAMLLELAIAALWVFRPVLPQRSGLFLALLFLLLLSLEYGTVIYLANGAVDPYYPRRFVRAMVAFLAVMWVVPMIVKRRSIAPGETWAYFSDIFLLLMVAQSLMAFAEYTIPPVRDFMYHYWINYPEDRVSEYRALGFTTAAALPSYLQVTGFYIAWDKIARSGSAFGPRLLAVMAVVSLAATFVMAQTGVLFLALSILPFALLTPSRGLMRLVWYCLPIFLAFAMGALWYWNEKLDKDDRERLRVTWVVKTDFITNYLDYKYVGNDSFEALRTMYFMPRTFRDLLFGNSFGLRLGAVGDPVDQLRANTDVGYVVDLSGIGIVGLSFSVLFYFLTLGFSIDSWLRSPPVAGSLIMIVLSIFFLVGHAKEVHLFTRCGFELYLFLFWAMHRTREAVAQRVPRGPAREASRPAVAA
jgi:hypothetical protein